MSFRLEIEFEFVHQMRCVITYACLSLDKQHGEEKFNLRSIQMKIL